MKSILKYLSVLFLLNVFFSYSAFSQQEIPLWPNGIKNNPVKYSEEKVRLGDVNESSPSQKNRVFSQVSEPTYTLFKAKKPNGVAVVICPGGGFRDVWFDREGVDFALWLAEKGITSMVLKYRTFNSDAKGFSLKREVYNPEVLADAKQAINILRSQADDLKIDKNKIGIGGFSAGGALSLYAALNIYEKDIPEYARFSENTAPDFVFPIYPGINDEVYKAVKQKENIPPMFLINGAEDTITPALKCIQLYTALLGKGVRAELHVYAKGNHGFDSGIGRGFGVASWQDSFINWLKDLKFME
jgi:acetyl esterase/lipase